MATFEDVLRDLVEFNFHTSEPFEKTQIEEMEHQFNINARVHGVESKSSITILKECDTESDGLAVFSFSYISPDDGELELMTFSIVFTDNW